MKTAARTGVIVLLALSAACVTQAKVEQAQIARRVVDLNEDGALEALQRSNPVHYDKVRKILDGVLRQRDAQVPRWIQTNFDGRDVSYGPIVLTSHPPKRRLSFALDATRYEAIIVLTNVSGEIVPAK
jgi:hypothetical protein